jgi:ABC-type nitrate/sulfonate/bicarbonate transport system substrate-binding protein
VPGPTRVTIVGVAEGAYYAPQIVALKLGFFEEEGLRITYHGQGDPQGLATAVSQGRADVALGGLWRPLLYSELGVEFVAFAQASAHPDLLVFGRVPREEFDWSSLSHGSLIFTSGGAPSPWLALQEALRNRQVDLGGLHVIPGLPPAEAIHCRQQLWPATPVMPREAVERWVQVLARGGLLAREIPFTAVVDPDIAGEAGFR